MKILIEFSRRHPWRSLVVIACLLVAGIAEGLGLSTVLPFVRLAMEEPGTGKLLSASGSVAMLKFSDVGDADR